MSPLWRNRLVAFVSPEQVRLLKLGRGLKPKLLASRDEIVNASGRQPAWHDALATLDGMLAAPEWQAAELDVVLSSRFVQYAVIPFNEQLKKYPEREAYARHFLSQTHGPGAAQWELRIQRSKHGASLVSAVEPALLDEARRICAAHKIKLHSITPYLTSTFNGFRDVLNASPAWLVVNEPGYSVFALLEGGRFAAVNGVFHSGLQDLPALLDRENLVAGLNEPCKRVYVHTTSNEAWTASPASRYEVTRLEAQNADSPAGYVELATGAGRRSGTLQLEYGQLPNPPRRAAGWMLLAAGLALFAEMGISYDRLHAERQQINRETSALGLRLDLLANVSGSRKATEKDLSAAREIVSRLSAPWEEFFASIESIKNDKVAILSMDPDIQTGQLTIGGEAKDYAALLTLVAQLRAKKTFADVFLQRHEIKSDDPQRPVRFSVSMRWVKP